MSLSETSNVHSQRGADKTVMFADVLEAAEDQDRLVDMADNWDVARIQIGVLEDSDSQRSVLSRLSQQARPNSSRCSQRAEVSATGK